MFVYIHERYTVFRTREQPGAINYNHEIGDVEFVILQGSEPKFFIQLFCTNKVFNRAQHIITPTAILKTKLRKKPNSYCSEAFQKSGK